MDQLGVNEMIKHSVATCKKPKMSHFKMGLKATKETTRLSDVTKQLMIFKGKAIFIDVNYCVFHSSGIVTGRTTINNKLYHVQKENGIWSIAQ